MMLAPAGELDARRMPVSTLRSYVRHGRPVQRFAATMQTQVMQPLATPLVSSARSAGAPAVVGVDTRHVTPFNRRTRSNRRGHEGFFPPVKKRGSMKSAKSAWSSESAPPGVGVYYPGNLELVPNSDLTQRYYSGHRSAPAESKAFMRLPSCPRAPESGRAYTNIASDEYRQTIGGDLSYLPMKKSFCVRKPVPFIDRQKIRRSGTFLSQIITSSDSETFNPDLRLQIAFIKRGAQ